jgi:polyhydroxyalkanoate synthase
VRPELIDLPVFLALPHRDRIVPRASAEALVDRLPRPPVVVQPRGGHIAMVVGPPVRNGLYLPLLRWLTSLAAMQERAC